MKWVPLCNTVLLLFIAFKICNMSSYSFWEFGRITEGVRAIEIKLETVRWWVEDYPKINRKRGK